MRAFCGGGTLVRVILLGGTLADASKFVKKSGGSACGTRFLKGARLWDAVCEGGPPAGTIL